MDCQACRGACCESFTIPASDIRPRAALDGSPAVAVFDERRWLELHATRSAEAELTFECRCTALTPEGRCGIYATRPVVCRLYVPGGADCLATVRDRRTPEQYAAIRGPQDPEAIHG